RACLLLSSAPSSTILEAAEAASSVRRGPPDEGDQSNIAALLLSSRGEALPVIEGQDPDADAHALAAHIVARAKQLLADLREGASLSSVSDADAVAFEAVLRVRGRPALRVEERLEPIDDEKHPGSGFWRPFFTQHELQLLEVASAAGAVVAKDNSG